MGCRERGWAQEGLGALDTLSRKRLHVKQSIYHALNTLKSHSHSDPHSNTLAASKRQPSPPEPTSPFGEYTFYSTKPDNETTPNDIAIRIRKLTWSSSIATVVVWIVMV